VFYALLESTSESDEQAAEAESLSESLRFYCTLFKANATTSKAVDDPAEQDGAHNDWVFLPEACSGPANRSLAPPASV
jgi:hypothetical protein